VDFGTSLSGADEAVVVSLSSAYQEKAITAWTEGVGAAGIKVMLSHIQAVLQDLLAESQNPTDVEDVAVLTGYRGNKFSLYIVFQKLYCEASCETMPLVVIEIARRVSLENTLWLVENMDEWNSNEGIFRVRVMMMFDMLSCSSPRQPFPESSSQPVFKGFNDTQLTKRYTRPTVCCWLQEHQC
jgi:hypothetical protein